MDEEKKSHSIELQELAKEIRGNTKNLSSMLSFLGDTSRRALPRLKNLGSLKEPYVTLKNYFDCLLVKIAVWIARYFFMKRPLPDKAEVAFYKLEIICSEATEGFKQLMEIEHYEPTVKKTFEYCGVSVPNKIEAIAKKLAEEEEK